MNDFNCRNCETSLAVDQRFCGGCGQRAGRERLTMRDIGHDLVHALTHADHSIFALVLSLATRPGHVAREFIEGKRKKHFGPFAFLLISVGLASFLTLATGLQWIKADAPSAAVDFLQRHFNLVVLLQLPLLAGTCALLFRNARLNYAEHLVFAAYTSGFRVLFFALVAVPAVYFTGVQPAGRIFTPTYLVLWLIYFAIAAAQFYRGSTVGVVVRSIIAALVSQAMVIGVVLAFIVLSEVIAH